MDEAERVAHRIAIIDHGELVAQGTPAELKAQTDTETLEGAFLALTGATIRDESASSSDQMRKLPDVVGSQPMSAIYILWLRQLNVICARACRSSARWGSRLLLLVGVRFRLRSRLQAAGAGKLHAVPGAGSDRHDRPVQLHVLRHRGDLGPPVRIPQGDTGCAGASNLSHDRPHARRSNHRHVPGSTDSSSVHSRRVPATALDQPRAGIHFRSHDRDPFRCAWNDAGFDDQRHGGSQPRHRISW